MGIVSLRKKLRCLKTNLDHKVQLLGVFWNAMEAQRDERTNGQTDKRTNGQTDKRTNRQTDKRTNGRTGKRVWVSSVAGFVDKDLIVLRWQPSAPNVFVSAALGPGTHMIDYKYSISYLESIVNIYLNLMGSVNH